MAYWCRLYNSIDLVDSLDWKRVASGCGDPIFSDRRFIAAVEAGMHRGCAFRHLIVYDGRSAVACTSLTILTIDTVHILPAKLASILRRFPRTFSKLRNLNVLLCGLPVDAGQHCLALASRNPSRDILSTIDEAVCKSAEETRPDVIIYKDFGSDDLNWVGSLRERGYQQISLPVMNVFTASFRDFEQYRAALRSHYRYKINRSLRKLKASGLQITILTDPDKIVEFYTHEVHDLYYQVLAKAKVKFETLPIEFFHELAVRLKGDVHLVALLLGPRPVAFGWCLRAGRTYHLLYAGLDYELNADVDLYFNLMYAWLDCGLRSGASRIEVGQTADDFKARLGCHPRPLYGFAKGLGPFMSVLVRIGAAFLSLSEPEHPAYNVFKDDLVK
jgi:Acetyltransferase (GNAT) domain